MKKITLIFLNFIACIIFSLNAQIIPPTFVWENKGDINIGGDLVVQPGQVINYSIEYKLGSTDGVNDTFEFILFGFEDNDNTSAGVNDAGWSLATDATNAFPGPGSSTPGAPTGTMTTTGSITIPATTPLTSEGTQAFRILAYVAYKPGGTGSTIFGGTGASDPQLILVKSIAEEPALSINNFEISTIAAYVYPNPTTGILNIGSEVVSETFKVYDITGKLIVQQQANSILDISNQTDGLYFLVTDSGSTRIVKI